MRSACSPRSRTRRSLFEGRWDERPYEVAKKGKTRSYRVEKPPAEWPGRLARPPGLHIFFDTVTVDGRPAPGIAVVTTLWAMNNLDALARRGHGVYFYLPKLQTPREALVVERLLSRLEGIAGVPVGSFKCKMLYEEGNAGRQLPAIVWVLRRRLLGTNVGRWDYLGSLIEMWREDPAGVFPDPQGVGMATPGMIAYQRFNALTMLMAGMKGGELANGAPIGGMAAVMIYQANDLYGRSRYNPIALRAMTIDKLRERLLGLTFVPATPLPAGARPTLEDVLEGRVKGKLHDTYRQSWVASPEAHYVAAGNRPLQAEVGELQGLVWAPFATVEVKGKPVPMPASGLSDAEREVFRARGLVDAQGRITPTVLDPADVATPERLLSAERWDAIYGVPKGEVTIEHVQHSLYMAANYGFQNPQRQLRGRDRRLRARPALHERPRHLPHLRLLALVAPAPRGAGDEGRPPPARGADRGRCGPRGAGGAGEGRHAARPGIFGKVIAYHDEWTAAFFAEQDRRGEPGRFDRSKAPVIMELLRRQLLSRRYLQHSARVLFAVGQAPAAERAGILDAVFDLDRDEIVRRVKAGTLAASALAAHDDALDVHV
ncbi:MAG: malate synthase [Anaeromyxobacteraceae bacterium]